MIDSGSELNTMTIVYAAKLDLKVHHTNVRTLKIDSSTLKIFGMVLARFQAKDKLGRTRFFQEIFLLADISAELVLDIPFLSLSNVNIQFIEKELT